jgi:hypothetical protein
MQKLSLITAGAILAIFAAASIQPAKASESDFKGYTRMPATSSPKPYNPGRSQSASPFKGYTAMPAGSSQSRTGNTKK